MNCNFLATSLLPLGQNQIPHHPEQKTTSVPKILMSTIVFSFVIYLIPRRIGAPLKTLSGYLPPLTSQEFVMNANLVSSGVVTEAFSKANESMVSTLREEGSGSCPKPKYAEMLHLPNGFQGYFDLEQAKQCAMTQNKPIFINFTGHVCVNCRAMEAKVWSDPKVLKILNSDYVVVAFYVDVKTELPEENWYVSEYDSKTKKSIGNQNADFQILAYNNNAQPLYALINADSKNLVEPKSYDLDIDNFVSFLESGLKVLRNTN